MIHDVPDFLRHELNDLSWTSLDELPPRLGADEAENIDFSAQTHGFLLGCVNIILDLGVGGLTVVNSSDSERVANLPHSLDLGEHGRHTNKIECDRRQKLDKMEIQMKTMLVDVN